MRKNRIYADTSVFGGVFDEEFASASIQFFKEVRLGRHVVLVSEVTNRELSRAPLNIQQFAAQLPAGAVENVATTQEMVDLT